MERAIRKRRTLLVPETIQVSSLDCGPAVLRSLLAGHGIPASYARLREACHTSIDGTSIDSLEEVANQLGLSAEQVIVPADHLLLRAAAAMPAITASLTPLQTLHFIVLWRQHGPWVQVMDPAVGRRWVRSEHLASELFVHEMPVPERDWCEHARSDEFLLPLEERLARLAIPHRSRERLLGRANFEPGWCSLGALDAAVRNAATLTRAGALRRGPEACRFVERLVEDTLGGRENPIPASYWSVRAHEPDEDGAPQLMLRGVVLVRARGASVSSGSQALADVHASSNVAPELQAVLSEERARPERAALAMMRAEGVLRPSVVMLALLAAAAVTIVEALLLRALIDVGQEVGLKQQRLHVIGGVLAFLVAGLLMELPIASAAFGFGRGLEVRLRHAFLTKLPRLADRYFRTRLVSDMAARSHAVHAVRMLPNLAFGFLRGVFGLVLVTGGIIWLDGGSAPLAIIAASAAIAVPLAVSPYLLERNLRAQTHAGAITRFYLDALLGLLPIRAHSAEPTMRREHESRMIDWARAGLSAQRAAVFAEAITLLTGLGLAAALVMRHTLGGSEPGALLLLVYWALALPEYGGQVALSLRQYPSFRNTTLRLMEVIDAPEHARSHLVQADVRTKAGVDIELDQVSVAVSGQPILSDVTARIPSGSLVAIVGASGAGKTSLVSVLLGWHTLTDGTIAIDGQELDANALERLRQETVWIDPSVQLWNRSLLENLRYGALEQDHHRIDDVLRDAGLQEVLYRVDRGLQTKLGEGGGLLSGGEGQRVRLARGMMRRDARLVILDEPFRGLERNARRAMMRRVRAYWPHATILCITHDVAEVSDAERVLVIEDGRVVEDGSACVLLERSGSRFARLLDADVALRREVWSGERWRHLKLEEGRLRQAS